MGKKLKYESCYDSVILEHEKKMAEKLRDILEPYEREFIRLGFTFTSELYWYDWKTRKVSYERFPFRKGYQYALSVKIEKEGEILWCNGEDYLFWATEMAFSYIGTRLFQTNVYLLEDTSEFTKDLDLFLETAKCTAAEK